MNDLTLWLGLAGGEVLLIVFVLLLVYWIRQSGAARRDREAVAKLISTARKGKATREEEIRQFLSAQMGLSDSALERAKTAILREEFRLLQGFADTYRRRDSSAAARFQMSVEAAVAPYCELRAKGDQDVTGDGQVDESELEALRSENVRLAEELSVTMDTMSRMLSEYSGMFSQQPVESPSAVDVPAAEVEISDTHDEIPAADVEPVVQGQAMPTGQDELSSEPTDPVEEPQDSRPEAVADDGALEETAAPGGTAEIVEPDSSDPVFEKDPLEDDPLEAGLGDLFDDDELDQADGDAAGQDATASEKDDVIAI